MEFAATLIVGVFVGLWLGATLQGRIDEKQIENGAMMHKGKVYIIRPAKVTEITP